MPDELIIYITKYGYLGIFSLVFLQEIGAPNPIPNELVLIFSGYMIFIGLLKLPFVIMAAVIADFSGTSILHTLFYFSGTYILQKKPRWMPLPIRAIDKLKKRISANELSGIYIGRLTPFIRGYTSVIAGLLQIKPGIFLPIALITALIWASFYIVAGILLGPFWNHVISNIKYFKYVLLFVFFMTLIIFVIGSLKKYENVKNE